LFIQDYHKTALIWKDEKISYASFMENIDCYASLLDADKDSRTAIFAENRPEWFYSFYGSWVKGKVPVPIDFMAVPEEVAYILNDCQPGIIFTSSANREKLEKALETVNYQPRIIVFDDVDVDNIREGLVFDTLDPDRFKVQDRENTAVIIYTSGTTGSPKGVMLSFDNIFVNVEATTEQVKIFTADDMILVLLPMHHIFPLQGTMIAPFLVGGTVVFTPSLNSADIIETLNRYGVSILIGVPRFYSLLCQGIMEKIKKSKRATLIYNIAAKCGSHTLSKFLFKQVHKKFGGHIKYLVSGGAALDKDVGNSFKTMGFEVLEGFGMTESAPMITFTRPGRVKIGSAGETLEGCRVEIREGEIVVSGRNIMQGYFGREEETAAVIKDGWLYTGDLGHFDSHGFLFITGRKKEIIVLPNGKNINPAELENKIIKGSDYIKEIGVFLKDNILQAIILPDLRKFPQHGFAEINERLKHDVIGGFNREVSSYKKIMKITVVTDDLPRTRLGKLKRFELPTLTDESTLRKKMAVEPKFQEFMVIRDFLGEQSDKEILADDHIEIDLGLDSLDKVSLLVFLKSTFGVEVKEQELMDYPTVHKLSEYIREKKTRISVRAIDWGKIIKEKVEHQLPQRWFTQTLIKTFSKIILKSYFRLNAKGVQNLPDEPFILAPNHQSFIDGLLVVSFLKNKVLKKTYFYAKEKHVRKRWVKFIANRNNVITVDVNKDIKDSVQKMATVLKSGKNIIIFPEGTRTKNGKVGEFKKTFAILSSELKVPVVPVYIKGAYEAMPSGSRIPRPFKKITVEFLPPVYPGDHSYDDLKEKVLKRVQNHQNEHEA